MTENIGKGGKNVLTRLCIVNENNEINNVLCDRSGIEK